MYLVYFVKQILMGYKDNNEPVETLRNQQSKRLIYT